MDHFPKIAHTTLSVAVLCQLFVILFEFPIFAQTPQQDQDHTQPLPSLMILPWQTPSIDPDFLHRTATARQAVIKELTAQFIPQGVTLDTIAASNPPLESARSMLKDVIAAKTSLKNPTSTKTTLALIPIWSKIHNYDFFGILIIDSTRNTIKALYHKIIPSTVWQQSLRAKNFQNFFEPEFKELASKTNLAVLPNSPEDIAVAFHDQSASPHPNEIDRTIVSLLLANELLPDMTMINPFASELLVSIHRFFHKSDLMRKSNRDISLQMIYEKPPVNASLPITLPINIRANDGVFGQTLPWTWNERINISAQSDSTVKISHQPNLKTELKQEQASLRRDELPQVVKIYGAWAYVDKGRAWGLQMNDRMLAMNAPTNIKGHVVAYFGPELKLKSARGWPIHEGAIIYIRKGQRQIKVGDILTYDKLNVPTPWPPVAKSP